MMNWYGNGMGGGGGFWLFMMLFWVVLIGVIVYAVIRLLPGGTRNDTPSNPPAPGLESPEQILDRMFATGEIDEQTYRARRTALAQMRKPS